MYIEDHIEVMVSLDPLYSTGQSSTYHSPPVWPHEICGITLGKGNTSIFS
jgi:hypothetical protein